MNALFRKISTTVFRPCGICQYCNCKSYFEQRVNFTNVDAKIAARKLAKTGNISKQTMSK